MPHATPTEPTPVSGPQPALHHANASYEACGSETPLLGLTIGQCLDQIADAYPDNEAVVSIPEGRRFTYSEFRGVVDRAAKALLRLGIQKGDRVAVWSTNNYEWLTAQYATAKIGAVLVNVNPAYRRHELEYVLRESRAGVLVLIESFKSSHYLEMLFDVCPEIRDAEPGHIESWRFPHLKSVVLIGSAAHPGVFTRRSFVELADDLDDGLLEQRASELDLDDDINIQYTSGTTGFPKGVTLTHNNVMNNAYFVAREMRLTHQDRLCVPVPFYHCFGMVLSNLTAMSVGATVVIPSPAFDAEATLRAVQDERCTALHGVPTMFIAELAHPDFDRFDLSTLRTGIMAGAPCPVDVMNEVIERMHMRHILIGYGQTECSPIATMTRPEDSVERRVGTVGRVMPHQELKIVDPVTRTTVRRGVAGEICFRGYHVMSGYDNMPEATAGAIDPRGWLASGDVGTMDDDGYVRIEGRIKDMVIRGGENIYPREIEEFLHGIDDVQNAAVVGVPDPKYGEELAAFVRLHEHTNAPTPDEFRAMCKGRIAHFKIPRYWFVVREFPMTVTGKIQKFQLRTQAIRELELDSSEAPAANRT